MREERNQEDSMPISKSNVSHSLVRQITLLRTAGSSNVSPNSARGRIYQSGLLTEDKGQGVRGLYFRWRANPDFQQHAWSWPCNSAATDEGEAIHFWGGHWWQGHLLLHVVLDRLWQWMLQPPHISKCRDTPFRSRVSVLRITMNGLQPNVAAKVQGTVYPVFSYRHYFVCWSRKERQTERFPLWFRVGNSPSSSCNSPD